MNRKDIFLLSLFLLLSAVCPVNAQVSWPNRSVDKPVENDEENLNVFQQWIRWNNPGSLLVNYLNEQAFGYYAQRDKEIEKLRTGDDWIARQKEVREKLMGFFGPLPEKGPLNPIVTGVIKKDGYRIEKIVFESFKGFYVTGCLYVPEKLKKRAPAVLNVIGHNQEAFRNPLYQVINYNLVKKGIIVFAIDPPGQGEHVQYWDPSVKFSLAGYSVLEHCYFGNQCFLSGFNCARYFIWDGMRAVDYLVSRKDVDPERLGVTGFSGGGTVTSYLGAYDDRIKVAIPCSWATASRKQLETKGGQDAEAEFWKMVSSGITLEDLLEVRAPKPTMMTFVSRDEYLCLQGAREAYRETGKAYAALGNPGNLRMVEDDSKHWMTHKIREAMYAFFMKHFNVAGDSTEVEAEILTPEELTVTPTGQIATYLGGKMIFDLNGADTKVLLDKLDKSRADIKDHLASVEKKAEEISGYRVPGEVQTEPFINGRYQRDGYSVGKYTIMGEGSYPIPFLLFIPNSTERQYPALIYLNPKGKAADARPGGEIEKLVRKGYIVAAADVLGVGETANTAARGITDGYTAVMIARSVVAIQAGDIVRMAQYLKSRPDTDPSRIGALGISEMCIPLLHAAAFDQTISNVTLIGPMISFRSVVMNRNYKIGLTPREGGNYWHPHEIDFSWGVAGALQAYDLPDLMGCIAPRKLMLADIKNQILEPASSEMIKEETDFPLKAYSFRGAPDNIKIVAGADDKLSLLSWSFR
jgi:cephalosporin-C deacetylase-like acetyl esterase